MPTNTYHYDFTGGVSATPGYGDRWQIQFGGTWALDEKWGLIFTTSVGDWDVGSINFYDASTFLSVCTTFKNRVYIGGKTKFNFSDNGDPTGWEQQNAGAGFQRYLSYFGSQDSVFAISQLQGRLVVIARRSIQIWTVDADPARFALVQEMDNIGSKAPLSAQNLGDFDVIILDDTGFRSLRTREVTLNAYVDDVGVSIDSFVQTDLLTVNAATCCAIVEPTTKNYWGFLNGKIYVLARYPSSKVSAWSYYLPTYEAYTTINSATANYVASLNSATVVAGSIYKWTPGAHEVSLVNGTQTLTVAGYFKAQGTSVVLHGTAPTATYTGLLQLVTTTTFTPVKFVVFNGGVYVLGSNREVFLYGGASNNVYDASVVTIQTPWLDNKAPKMMKMVQAVDAALSGSWLISMSADPTSGTFLNAFTSVSPTGSELTDSTYDLRRIGWSQRGTHLSMLLTSDPTWAQAASVSEIQIHYGIAEGV